jgi:hypothetical protein
MFRREKEIVNASFIKSGIAYNIVEGGYGSFSYINSLPNQGHGPNQRKEASEKGNKAFSEKLKSDPAFKQQFSETMSKSMRLQYETGTRSVTVTTNRRWISNDTEAKSIFVQIDELDLYIRSGWYLGRTYKHWSNLGKKYKKRN